MTSYGLLLILFITIAFNLDKFDARKFSPLSAKDQIFFKNESFETGKSLNLDEVLIEIYQLKHLMDLM
ncbi:hypothetical protein INT82_09670 [Mannheimia haemolytica]|nr:hypothetical protein [Mannheimia haemolytica]